MILKVTTCFLILIFITSPLPAEDAFSDLEGEWERLSQNITSNYEAYEKGELDKWEMMKKRVMQKWEKAELPEVKTFVDYFEDDTARIKVDYEKGIVVVEALTDSPAQQKEAKEKIKQALSTALSQKKNDSPLIYVDEFQEEKQETSKVVENLLTKVEKVDNQNGSDGTTRARFQLTFKLVPSHVVNRAKKYYPTVKFWAEKYKLSPALILGIIRQESSFNPRARSWVPALGLMQIVPKYSGREVLSTVTKKQITPDTDFLYDPEKNIMIGSTYLQLLRDKYFPDVSDKTKQTYYMISGFNWGPHRIKSAIKRGRLPASLTPEDTFLKIQQIAPKETSDYLKKVTQYSVEFNRLLQNGSL